MNVASLQIGLHCRRGLETAKNALRGSDFHANRMRICSFLRLGGRIIKMGGGGRQIFKEIEITGYPLKVEF